MSKTAVIIGGGVGGLSAAIRLAARGAQVILLEKNARLGGKLNTWAVPHPNRPSHAAPDRPFKFDTGPSLLTLPLLFADLFHAAGEDVRNYLSIQRLDPIARFQWCDGTTLDLRADEEDRLREVKRIAPNDVHGFERFYRRGELIWNLSADTFLSKAPEEALRRHGFSPLAGLQLLTTPLRIGMFSNYARWIDRHVHHPKLRDVLYHYATYSGSSPFHAPATLAVIPYVEMSFGAWHIPGGMYKLAEALESLARKLGVQIRVDCAVKQILIEPTRQRGKAGTVTGVQTASGETIRADCVIANSDVVYTYHQLIEARFRKRHEDARLCRIDPGGSGMVLMLGVRNLSAPGASQ
jgi:phytoene desaturase